MRGFFFILSHATVRVQYLIICFAESKILGLYLHRWDAVQYLFSIRVECWELFALPFSLFIYIATYPNSP